MVSPYYVGAVVTMTGLRGYGDYSYSLAEGGGRWTVGTETGVVSLVQPLGTVASGRGVFVVTDDAGQQARFVLNMQVATREAYGSRERLYLVGGTAKDGQLTYGDVWRSADGKDWERVRLTTYYGQRWGHRMVSHEGNLWVVAGFRSSPSNDVWRSTDAVNWHLVPASSSKFSSRYGHQMVFHKGSLWLVGGLGRGSQRDVWRSANGADWELVTAAAAFAAREFHQVVSHGGSLWLSGGSAGFGRFRDVWRSGNGADWHLVTATAAFSARNAHQMVSHRGSLWLLGGAAGIEGGSSLMMCGGRRTGRFGLR